jgi:hypothetical protein
MTILVLGSTQFVGCQLLFGSAIAAGSVVRAAQYTAEDALVAEERPQVIAERMIVGVRSRGELRGVHRDRDALALGEIIIRGNVWGYSFDDRKAALNELIGAAERVNADLQPSGETDLLTEPAKDLVRITLAAIDRCVAAEIMEYSRGRLAIIPPGPVRDAFESETADETAFSQGLFQFRIVSNNSISAVGYRKHGDPWIADF